MIVAVVALTAVAFMMGGFFLPIFKDLHRDWQGGKHSAIPLLAFGGMAAVMFAAVVISVVRGVRKASSADAGENQPREPQPWLKRPDWAAGEILSTDNNSYAPLLFMGIAFCAIGGAGSYGAITKELPKGNKAALLALLFPLVGLGLLGAAGYTFLRRKKFGAVSFKMSAVPGTVGGTLTGSIHIPSHFQPQSGVRLQLRCVRRVVTGSGKERRVSETFLWEDEKTLGENLPRTGLDEFAVPVFFRIPGDARETDNRQPDDQIIWRLTATSKQAGIDFRADFDLPVFRTAQSSAASTIAADATAKYQVPFDPLRTAAEFGIKVSDAPGGGREFFLPASRNFGPKFGLGVFCVVFSGALFAMVRFHAPIIFSVVFGIVDLIVTSVFIDALLRASRIVAAREGLQTRTTWLWLGRARNFSPAEIQGFNIVNGMTSGETAYYDVKLNLASAPKRSVTIATAIRSRHEAEWLASELERALGRQG